MAVFSSGDSWNFVSCPLTSYHPLLVKKKGRKRNSFDFPSNFPSNFPVVSVPVIAFEQLSLSLECTKFRSTLTKLFSSFLHGGENLDLIRAVTYYVTLILLITLNLSCNVVISKLISPRILRNLTGSYDRLWCSFVVRCLFVVCNALLSPPWILWTAEDMKSW